MSFLDRIRACNTRDLRGYRPFQVGGVHVGFVRQDMAEAIRPYADVFAVDDKAVVLNPKLRTFEERTAAVEVILRRVAKTGIMSPWRDEPYAVTAAFGAPGLFAMERAAVALFGIRAYGVHLNGYVRQKGSLSLWIGRRSRDKHTYPGMLDNMVAGGLPYGLTARECLVKECAEEAGIPEEWAAGAVPVGAITYCAGTTEGLRPDVLFCYDLELPEDFTPACQDGEIESFTLMPVDEVAAIVRDTEEFKFNCNLVIIDFLVRHGFIGPDEPDYVAIVQGLHQ
jgi:8-oxo-dGTP pyrophosphatase MutT (NUDIX family)